MSGWNQAFNGYKQKIAATANLIQGVLINLTQIKKLKIWDWNNLRSVKSGRRYSINVTEGANIKQGSSK